MLYNATSGLIAAHLPVAAATNKGMQHVTPAAIHSNPNIVYLALDA